MHAHFMVAGYLAVQLALVYVHAIADDHRLLICMQMRCIYIFNIYNLMHCMASCKLRVDQVNIKLVSSIYAS